MKPTVPIRHIAPSFHTLNLLLIGREELQQRLALPVLLHLRPGLVPLKYPRPILRVETAQHEERVGARFLALHVTRYFRQSSQHLVALPVRTRDACVVEHPAFLHITGLVEEAGDVFVVCEVQLLSSSAVQIVVFLTIFWVWKKSDQCSTVKIATYREEHKITMIGMPVGPNLWLDEIRTPVVIVGGILDKKTSIALL